MNKTESGRSMVEMLGVLAIIGVLSVGGIAGYTMAMNKFRANEIMNCASLTVVEAVAAGENRTYVSDIATAFPSSISAYLDHITATPTTVTIKCNDVSAEPCKTVKTQLDGKYIGDNKVSVS